MQTKITVDHQISTGHRIVGHEGKCARLHGHDYRFHVELEADELVGCGFVADFGDVKAILNEWDHRLLLWENDTEVDFAGDLEYEESIGVLRVPFNPTAEHMANHLTHRLLAEFPTLMWVDVELWETPKASARVILNRYGLPGDE